MFLLAGLSNFSFAQGRHSGKKNGLETNKKVEPRKQMFHFDKREKDKKMASNGTTYRKPQKYRKVDGDGFKSSNGVAKNSKFVSDSRKQKKRYKKQLNRSVYARNNDGYSLWNQRVFGR